MNALRNSALGLLVITGALLGLSLPFGKIATEAGVPPVVWAFVISAGGGGAILAAMLLRGERVRLTARKLRYFLITAAITYALPNLLLFSVMPHVGAGYAGIMYTLSPILTLVLSILFGVRKPNLLGILGIAIGFVGAVMVATTRGQLGEPAALFWVAVALVIRSASPAATSTAPSTGRPTPPAGARRRQQPRRRPHPACRNRRFCPACPR
ncbi:MAG: DMT family transporter [Asticcacaulis sp.]|nr:DMT family transporter [Asticcacaulis sp.]